MAHAREEAPNECCGLVSADADEAVRVHRITNSAASALRYEMDSKELFEAVEQIEEAGQRVGAIYHSHTRTDPYPSQTDVNWAFFGNSDDETWPGAVYVIVGLEGGEPDVRAYRIPARDRIEEVGLEVAG